MLGGQSLMSTLFEDGLPVPTTLSSHRHTPTLTVIDPRGLAVRVVGYLRESDSEIPLVNRTVHDSAGRATAQWDPRLFLDTSAPANLQTIFSFSGTALSTSSVDAGFRVMLFGELGQPIHNWDGRGSQQWMLYDERLRLCALFEECENGEAICVERLSYGASDQAAVDHNQCGQLIRHDDPAGTQLFTEFGMSGAALAQTRHFLQELTIPDWPESMADRERMVEHGDGSITRSKFNAPGEAIEQTDAKGHRQLFSQTLNGQLREARLQLNGESTAKTLASAIHYNAHGQTEREIAGNGIITTLDYDAADGRLTRLQAKRGSEILQDLGYAYDPVGNVLSIEDGALPIRYFANQRVEPISHYFYDTLYRLIEATGWEAGAPNKGPVSTIDDPMPCANYRQRYGYDHGGNLLELIHEGPQQHGHRLVAAAHSNRCLPVLAGVEPDEEDFRRDFDANGNLLNLQPGQALGWDLRNQLREVRPVVRASGLNDYEHYVYAANGMRLRKVRSLQTNARTLISEVRYLPSLELRSHSGTGEVLQVITVQAGRCSVQVLHWESAPPKDSANDQYRYSLNDHLGSCNLELDENGEVISQERYHPYGTTAWFAGRGEIEASYKTVRYSGKERDSTGLYYYGFRYYVSWLQRWLNPDPAGVVDGLALFSFVRNSPLKNVDRLGSVTDEALVAAMENSHAAGIELVSHGFESFTMTQAMKVDESIQLAKNMLSGAMSDLAAKKISEDTRAELVSSFGVAIQKKIKPGGKLVKEIHNNLAAISSGIDEIEKGQMKNILFVKYPAGRRTLGETYHALRSVDANAVIFLNIDLVENRHFLKLATVIIHEVAHWKLNANDFLYQSPPITKNDLSSEELIEVIGGFNWRSENALRAGPDESNMSSSTQDRYRTLFFKGRSLIADEQQREKAYLSDVKVRKSVLLENADFYPSIATRVYYRNRQDLVVNG